MFIFAIKPQDGQSETNKNCYYGYINKWEDGSKMEWILL